MKNNVNKIIETITKTLLPCCQDKSSAQTEGWWLLEKLTNKSQAELIREEEIAFSKEQQTTLNHWLYKRIQEHKPLQYILGTVPFYDLEIFVEPPVLIPRPETEEWCAWLIKKLEPVKNESLDILDIGAGSGCIALTLAKKLPNANVIGVDIHPNAIKLCKKNKTHNNIKNITFLQSDLYKALTKNHSFDLIVSNPPYITEKDFSTLSKDVTQWEDKSALVANENGFAIHKQIIEQAKEFLKPNSTLQKLKLPQLVLEFGKGQEQHLQKLLQQSNFTNVKLYKDMEEVYRWASAF